MQIEGFMISCRARIEFNSRFRTLRPTDQFGKLGVDWPAPNRIKRDVPRAADLLQLDELGEIAFSFSRNLPGDRLAKHHEIGAETVELQRQSGATVSLPEGICRTHAAADGVKNLRLLADDAEGEILRRRLVFAVDDKVDFGITGCAMDVVEVSRVLRLTGVGAVGFHAIGEQNLARRFPPDDTTFA